MKYSTLYAISSALDDMFFKRSRQYDEAHDTLHSIERRFLQYYGESWENKLSADENAEWHKAKMNDEMYKISYDNITAAMDDFRAHNFK